MEMIPNKGLPKVAKTEPAGFTPEAGKIYAWCSCGLSEKQPFCDGSHKRIEPIINEQGEYVMAYKSLKFQVEEVEEVWLCQCKQTKTPPYCDGSHNKFKD
jgi:CDGSH iron-sulfur domain-containing protein 3